MLDDLTAGQNVRATIYMESGEHWHRTGPEHLRSVGETSHALHIVQQYANSRGPKIAAGIISHADLTLGRDSEAALHAHRQAGGTHFKGARAYLFWDEKIDIGIANQAKGMAASSAFRTGFSRLSPLELVCDVMAYCTNLPEIAELAAAFPGTDIFLNHCGGPVGVPPYDADATDMFGIWQQNLKKLACYPNVRMNWRHGRSVLWAAHAAPSAFTILATKFRAIGAGDAAIRGSMY